MRLTTLLGFVVLFCRIAPGQAAPSASEILKQVGETYKGVSEYELVAEQTVKLPGSGAPQLVHTRIAFKAPNRYRLEGTIPGLV